MKTIKALLFTASVLLLSSCGSEEPKVPEQRAPNESPKKVMLEKIRRYEAEMHRSMQLDPNTATLAVSAYDEYVRLFPEDSLSPDFTFKAGEISTANHQYKQALMYYEKITAKYPGFRLAPESLYLQAYLLDNFLNDEKRAKIIYDSVIVKYPDLPYASDAKAAIKNLGKSDADLIREFEKKNKRK